MKTNVIHCAGDDLHAPGLRCALRLAGAVLLSVSLVGQPALAQGETTSGASDVLAGYQARHERALTIEHELTQRVSALEQQNASDVARRDQLQVRLGELMQLGQTNDASIVKLQAEAAAKQSQLVEARKRLEELEHKLREVHAKIQKNEREKVTCYIPFAQLYCWFADLSGQREELEKQRRFHIGQLQSIEQERYETQARLERVQRESEKIEAEQARLQGEIDVVVQRLKVVHAELANNREAQQRHRLSLDSFSAELKQVETLPPTDRPTVIERRLVRLDAQLASEMGQACSLFTGGGTPMPEPVRQACAPA